MGRRAGFAVTPEIVAALGDEEVAAELALDTAAARSVLELSSPRRIVIVAEVPLRRVTPAPDLHPTGVRFDGPLAMGDVACIFVDEEGSEADARAAAAGDAAALDRLEERTMLWYDVSEIAHLVTGLGDG